MRYTITNQYGQPIARTNSREVATVIALYWSARFAIADVQELMDEPAVSSVLARYEFGEEL